MNLDKINSGYIDLLQDLKWKIKTAQIRASLSVNRDKIKSIEEQLWYARQIVENGRSRNILVHQIEGQLYRRQVLANKTTNFDKSLIPPHDCYSFQVAFVL